MSVFIGVIRVIFGLFLIYAGYMHFKKPTFFNGFIPKPLPKLTVNYIAGFIEIAIGFGLLFNQSAKNAALCFFILMLIFLPLHIWDLTKEKPAIGSKKLATIRIPLQFVLLYGAYLIYLHS
ncbi:DoxX family protein [Tenacibaculum aquimarinum]|uniref:DoxX family protein n=1 Tax=Tenacibaculum aquimarinum TaxID=2910675 RepID=UPI001F0A1A9B|nr:MauE/DoxX family redox-associated membrane protein [Tenacibaculum aquimarinum]MCH3885940.1 DoxX family membrane protein [Tenacibaculum aquimarinum]